MLGSTLVSKDPYRMSILELVELKVQLQELLDKNYIQPSIFLWEAPMFFIKEKNGTLRVCINYMQLNKVIVMHQLPK